MSSDLNASSAVPMVAGKKFWKDPRWLLALYLIIGLGWCLQTVLHELHPFHPDKWQETLKCTFFTFHDSFFGLIHHHSLYPGPANNVFKYSPTFALFFAPFALPPVGVGMFLWITVNFMAFFAVIWFLPFRPMDRVIMLWVSLFDLMVANQDWQSNGIVVACILGPFLCLNKGWSEAAALCVIAGLSIKIYGAAGAIFFLFYPRKSKFIVSLLVVGLAAFLLPLLVISWGELLAQYRNWYQILHQDASHHIKLSVMGLIHRLTGWTPPVLGIEIVAMLVMLLPLVRTDLYDQLSFRLRMAASILLGVVIFNYMADRQAFVIAAAGGTLWYMLSSRDRFRTTLFLLIIVFSFKSVLRPIEIKVIPFALMWIILQVELWWQRHDDDSGGVGDAQQSG